ncbi:DUF3105 domain-containing protein [Nocardioides sambongensis]|uniref:DUF3105 domain-containing protein n=1 Tax=Nocardioides sambongensis TaxID=2589074 RepID=UPI00112DF685|nr:DUF3105 domain-containing protein [Nocardioides sambongensis]
MSDDNSPTPPPPPPFDRSRPPAGPPPPSGPPSLPAAPPAPYGPPHYGPPAFPPPRRNRTLPVVLGVVAAVVVLAVALIVPVLMLGDDDGDEGARGGEDAGRAIPEDLDDVQVYDDLDPTHRTGEIDYPTSPPVGGPHNPAWLECGVYDRQVNAENLVHDLEHGTVVITYRDDLVDDDAVDLLAAALPDNGILTPWAEQQAPVVITVWGRQLELVGAEDPRIELFIDAFGAGETAPEPFASCAGGLADAGGTLA